MDVTTQQELDAALAAGEEYIVIRSPRGVWLHVSSTGSATVRAYGSATVRAYGSATVRAFGSATVRAYGSATVRAFGSTTVEASDSATVEASRFVAVHLFHGTASVTGGVVIDVTARDDDGQSWCDYHGVEVIDGVVVLHKAVLDDWTSGLGAEWTYSPGSTVTAQDFEPTRECGQGLHLCATPAQSARYLGRAVRYVAVEVDVAQIVPLGDKCKVPSCRVLHEVDRHGKAVA